MKCPTCSEELYSTYLCANCGHDCEDDLMNPRQQIIADLDQANLINDYTDFSRIASALERGESKEEILFRPELERWPKVFSFLKDRL